MEVPDVPGEVVLDLRDDVTRVAEFIRQAARHCATAVPGEPVRGVEVFFGLQHGFVRVTLFSRPDYQPLYGYSGQRHAAQMAFPRWADFFARWFEVPSRAVFPDGSVLRATPGHDPVLDVATAEGGLGVVRATGLALGRVLAGLAAEGAFDPLGGQPVLGVTDESDFWWSSDGRNPGV